VSVLIKNGRVVTASDDYVADVYVHDTTVTLIGQALEIEADKVIDAAGKLVIPGGIDPHTHLELPFGGTTNSDTFETGTRAAAYGGTTCIIDFAVQMKGQSTIEALDTWHQKAAGNTAVDYAFHMIITDMPQERAPEMRRLADEGITSYKLFMAYPGAMLSDDGTIFRAMRKAGEDGTLVCMHAENGIVIDELIKIALAEGHIEPKQHALTRPTRLEAEGTHRALAIAEVARSPVYIVHLSAYDSLKELRDAQARGVMAHAETCPQYLLLDVTAYDEPGFDGAKYVLTPPLREKWNQDELWNGLRCGDVNVISTDHCPFCRSGSWRNRQNGFLQDPERRAGGREPDEPDLSLRRRHGADRLEPLRRAHLDGARQDLRALPQEGHDRRGQRRRYRRLRSQPRGDDQRPQSQVPPHEHRLQRLRGHAGAGLHRDRNQPRQSGDRQGAVCGPRRRRHVRQARALRRRARGNEPERPRQRRGLSGRRAVGCGLLRAFKNIVGGQEHCRRRQPIFPSPLEGEG